jgi:hypothetical protein
MVAGTGGLRAGTRLGITAAVIAALLLSSQPFSVPNWAVVVLLVVVLPLSVVVTVRRFRQERNLARTLWRVVTRR